MNTEYTVRRVRAKEDTLYGPSHGSDDADNTLCGIVLDWKTYITHTRHDGEVTCKTCKGILKNRGGDAGVAQLGRAAHS